MVTAIGVKLSILNLVLASELHVDDCFHYTPNFIFTALGEFLWTVGVLDPQFLHTAMKLKAVGGLFQVRSMRFAKDVRRQLALIMMRKNPGICFIALSGIWAVHFDGSILVLLYL